jgi:hypothetical protein
VSEFPGVALAFSVIRTKGNKTGGDKALADNATIGNVEFVNVLKTTD